ncbi:uncharacterized protein LOC114349332 isoform X2 [Diabrotica virgifera virgifera]|uniref:Uncharacterized protein LOC114349332 isoform X2 n=1 Tax=Diabrotica virgifera virgifera TaxID=50390 RepID=A0A6P7HCX9_DIAVI|nr:uncharacterized protein LOC114349332 isoform X2 [Diabrotica virgifera virgifera]
MSDNESCNKDESEENSDDNLHIAIESPSRKRKPSPVPTESERKIIEYIEDELEHKLEEKAAKSNLNVINVKNIIKHVLTSEDVLNLIKDAEGSKSGENISPLFELKWTRSKVKELSSASGLPLPPVNLTAPKPASEVQVLFTEELQEDSSGDEYIPGMGDEDKDDMEESEDDPDNSLFSDPPSIEPETPPEQHVASPPPPPQPNTDADTHWTEDGVFKIPSAPKDKEEPTDETTIAKRTRSKLSLSSTPLEVIEEAFIPPDIPPDLYEMHCDNEDWRDFLKTFTRPLEEVEKVPEEEELDPEYNVLSDEEIDKPDKEELREELRVDRAVKVSKKELNALIAELYEFCSNEQAHLDGIEEDDFDPTSFLETQLVEDNSKKTDTLFQTKTDDARLYTDMQINLLEQQMRQHVQLLTQNFILTYEHPEIHQHAKQMKEYLLNLKYLAGDNEESKFCAVNLEEALDLVSSWEELVASNTDDVKRMKSHVESTMNKSLACTQKGIEYIVTFPSLILETISSSCVFLYPSLLPKIPFKSPRCFHSKVFTNPELQLVSIGLEQFLPFATQELGSGKVAKKKLHEYLSYFIHEYVLPIKSPRQIERLISRCEYTRCGANPIKYFFTFKKAPSYVQFYIPLEALKILPPCQRKPEELPYQWKKFCFPSHDKDNRTPNPLPTQINSIGLQNITKNPLSTQINSFWLQPVSQPISNTQQLILPKGAISLGNSNSQLILSNNTQQQLILPKGVTTSTPLSVVQRKKPLRKRSRRQSLFQSRLDKVKQDPISKFVRILCEPSPINKILRLFSSVSRSHTSEDTTTDEEISPPPKKSNLLSPGVSPNTSFKENISLPVTDTHNMLPNMPSLSSVIKINSLNEDTGNEGKNTNSSKHNISLEISEEGVSDFQSISEHSEENKMDKDNSDGSNILTATPSTTKTSITKKELSGAEKKRAKMKREFLANLAISTPEDYEVEQEKHKMFALAYYDKLRETLDLQTYHKMTQILCDYEKDDALELYYKVEAVLSVKYKELADEFLLFLQEKEAAAAGRLIPWIQMNNRSKFLRKVETFFKDQPAQLRKIYQSLTELSHTVGVTKEKMKSSLVPMFKGNTFLTDLFLQNFMDEPPPPSLMEGPYEVIDVNKELATNDDEEPFETITVPDVEDKYGGITCICSCHEIEDVEFKSRIRHCSRCGTKFLNGRVYIQTGRGLRPAAVSFLNSSNTDHSSRLSEKSSHSFIRRKKRSDTSPSKQVSQSSVKDNPDEETDEDGEKKKKPKRKPRSKKPKLSDDNKDVTKKATPSKVRNLSKEFKSTPRKRTYLKKMNTTLKVEPMKIGIEEQEHIETELDEHVETEQEEQVETELEEQVDTYTDDKTYIKPGTSNGQQKRLHDESCEEGDQSAAGESSGEVKLGSPEQQTADSESEFCEESSQDNCESDSNSSTSSIINTPQSYADVLSHNSSWKREEDKIILEGFQTENDKDRAFKAIANQLRNRTVDEIKARFDTLMDLLMKTVEDHRD